MNNGGKYCELLLTIFAIRSSFHDKQAFGHNAGGFWSRGINRPFCFENQEGEAIIVNGDRYRAMLNEFLFTKIEEEDISNIWFQQDGATCYTAEATLDVLLPVFEDRIISRRANVV